MENPEHRLAAIVFTDVVGYTRQMEKDERRMMQLLQQQREIIFPIVKSYGGEVVKELGDGLLMMFSSAIDAVRCTIVIQTRLKDEELTIRAGIHIGEIIFKEGDVFGSAVNVAARIQPLASANGICISEDVKNQIRNKTEIRMQSIGTKELKGINDPMEIYEILIEGITYARKKNIKHFLGDLWSKRIFHVVVAYLVGAWLIRMAISSFADSKLLSPHLVDLAWVILLTMIPSVFLLTYYHGSKSAGKWARAELIGFPLNAVFSILLVLFLFKGKDLGAATTSVVIEDENGNKTERTILKNEFRPKTLIFFFKNNSSDTSLDWMQYAFPMLTEYDALQDIFLETITADQFFDEIINAGYKDGITDDLSLERKLAEKHHRNYFMTGYFSMSAGNYTVSTRLYNTQTGKPVAENQFSGPDLFKIVDEITSKLKKDVGIPESHIGETVDLPVSEIYTSSVKALEYYIKGQLELSFNHDLVQGIQLINKAIGEDKDFIWARVTNSYLYLQNNQPEEAMATAQIVMDKLYKLPEGVQFNFRYTYYTINYEPEKVLNLCLQWTRLYPENISAHQYLAGVYYQRNEGDKFIEEQKIILGLDPGRLDILEQLGNIYILKEDYDSSEYFYRQYLQAAPGDFLPYYDLGILYFVKPDFEKAAENFENALLLDPANITVKLDYASVNLIQGELVKAEKIYNEALVSSKSPDDSASVYFRMAEYYHFRGELRKAIELYTIGMEIFSRYSTPLEIAQKSDDITDYYIQCGRAEEAFIMLKKSEEQLGSQYKNICAFGYLNYYIELGNADEAGKYLPPAIQALEDFGLQIDRDEILLAKAQIAELRQEYGTALDYFQKYREMNPTSWKTMGDISRCQRKTGELKKAKKSVELCLIHIPYDPSSNYEAAMLYLEMNDMQKAGEYLQRTLEIWQNADTNYNPYKEALALKVKL
jgi:class 3 adenylate cyclase/tetratricopeptide (TPR) repeat protein